MYDLLNAMVFLGQHYSRKKACRIVRGSLVYAIYSHYPQGLRCEYSSFTAGRATSVMIPREGSRVSFDLYQARVQVQHTNECTLLRYAGLGLPNSIFLVLDI